MEKLMLVAKFAPWSFGLLEAVYVVNLGGLYGTTVIVLSFSR
jgi:hypothetical protein